MIFVHMLYDACRSVVDVSTLSAVSGDIFMIFVYMVYNVCRSVVDVSTLSAVPGDVFFDLCTFGLRCVPERC